MLSLIYYGREELRTPCQKVSSEEFKKKELLNLVDEMYKTMLKASGIGLAANQIGINKQIAIVEIQKGQRIDLINPEIEILSPKMEDGQEGCLSIPKIFSNVSRYLFLKVRSYNLFGQKVEFKASHLLARVIQHEIDHLNGFLYIDRLSDLNKNKLNSDLKKLNQNHKFKKIK